MTTIGLAPRNDLTVTIELTATAGVLGDDLIRTLDDVRERLGRLGTATVTVRASGPEERAPTPDPDGDRLLINPDARTARIGAAELDLSRLEFDLLLFFAEHPGRVFSRVQLLDHVWGEPQHIGRRTIDVHIRRLRMKIGERFPLVTTIRGVGYRFDGGGRVAVTRA